MAFYFLMLQYVFPKNRDILLLKHCYSVPILLVLLNYVLYSIFLLQYRVWTKIRYGV